MLKYLVYNHPHLVAAGVLVPLGLVVWWLTGDYSPLTFLVGGAF